MVQLADLAKTVLVDEGDVRYLISDYPAIDLQEDGVPRGIAEEVHNILNPACERTVPWLYDAEMMQRWRDENGVRAPHCGDEPEWG